MVPVSLISMEQPAGDRTHRIRAVMARIMIIAVMKNKEKQSNCVGDCEDNDEDGCGDSE